MPLRTRSSKGHCQRLQSVNQRTSGKRADYRTKQSSTSFYFWCCSREWKSVGATEATSKWSHRRKWRLHWKGCRYDSNTSHWAGALSWSWWGCGEFSTRRHSDTFWGSADYRSKEGHLKSRNQTGRSDFGYGSWTGLHYGQRNGAWWHHDAGSANSESRAGDGWWHSTRREYFWDHDLPAETGIEPAGNNQGRLRRYKEEQESRRFS